MEAPYNGGGLIGAEHVRIPNSSLIGPTQTDRGSTSTLNLVFCYAFSVSRLSPRNEAVPDFPTVVRSRLLFRESGHSNDPT